MVFCRPIVRAALLLSAALATCAEPAHAGVPLRGTYAENFDGMGPGGTVTPANWYVGGLAGTDGAVDASGHGAITGTTLQVDNGSVAAGAGTIGNCNYGATGGTDRSLGSLATTARGHRAMEVRIDNRTGFGIGSFEIRYDGEQWRRENAGDQALVLMYSTDGVSFVAMGAAFDFHSVQDTGAAGPLDGNAVRVAAVGGVYTPAAPIPLNGTFYLRWFDFNDAGVADHGLAIDNVTISNPLPPGGTVLTFQDGPGYSGTVDTFLRQASPSTAQGEAVVVEWDGDDSGGINSALLRFDGIFGTGPGQIAPSDTITSAAVIYEVIDSGDAATVNEVSVDWSETETFNAFGGDAGVQSDEYGANIGAATGSPVGPQVLDVTSSVLAWKAAPTTNRGWIFRPTGGTNGVQFRSSEDANPALRPILRVVVNGGPPPRRTLTVKHQPYLQLGDAPLVSTGPGIGTSDRITIMWQTVESGGGLAPDDFFEVEYRAGGAPAYTPAGSPTRLVTGAGTRVNHSVEITGLTYDATYDYRVIHKRSPAEPEVIATYEGTFRARRASGSPEAFAFAAHGDSANIHSASELAQFEKVNSRITSGAAEFVLLLGDNVYDSGTHDEFDARLDASRVPVNSAYIRNHVEYFCMGNHDAGSGAGLPSLHNYAVPIPSLGVTSPVAPPVGEVPEKNYSFDYGMVHFTVIDSTAWGGPGVSAARQQAITGWLAADLGASSLPWKIVAAHHPPKSNFGHTDTGEGMAAEIIPVIVQNGADLLLVGHSHNYQRSFPLTGYAANDVTYVLDESGVYTKGSQVLQVIAGTGGRNIDCCAPTTATQWLARAFGSNNGGEVGPLMIDVSRAEMRVRYVSAASGATKDEFVIVPPGPTIAVHPPAITRTVYLGDALPNDTFSVRNSGPGTITYSVTPDAPWLSVSPASGTSTGESDDITLAYDGVATLPRGVHVATVSVSAPEALNSPRALTVTVTVRTVKPDMNGDGDVDQEDFGVFQRCLSGNLPQPEPSCATAKMDGDGDVDEQDFLIFFECMSGADTAAVRTCAG